MLQNNSYFKIRSVYFFLSLVFFFSVACKLYYSSSPRVRGKCDLLKSIFPLFFQNDFSTWHLASFFYIIRQFANINRCLFLAQVSQSLKACMLFRLSIRKRTRRGRKKKKNSRALLIFIARQKTVANLLSGGVGRLL